MSYSTDNPDAAFVYTPGSTTQVLSALSTKIGNFVVSVTVSLVNNPAITATV